MYIKKYEQSGFIFESQNGIKIAIDIGRMTHLEKLENLTVNYFVVSHVHADHFSLEHIKKTKPKKVYLSQECIDEIKEPVDFEIVKIKFNDEVMIEDISIKCFEVNHGPNVVHPKENFGFLFTIDNQKIYFAGDMFYPSGIDVSSLKVSYALIPVGTFYTFGPEEAFQFCKKFSDIKKIIPMHYFKKPETLKQFSDLASKDFLIESNLE